MSGHGANLDLADAERRLAAWMADVAPASAPGHVIDDGIARAVAGRQRPAWLMKVGPGRARREGPPGRLMLAIGAMGLVAAAAGLVALGGGRLAGPNGPTPALPALVASPAPATSAQPDLLDAVRAAGVLRVGVVGALDGYDAAVATRVAEALGVRVQLSVYSKELATGFAGAAGDTFDVIVGYVITGTGNEMLIPSRAYGYRPILVAVPAASPVQTVAALAGRRVCVALGGEPQLWAMGTNEVITPLARQDPPPEVTLVTEPTEADCVASLAKGTVDGVYGDSWTASQLTDPRIRFVGDPIEVEQLAFAVPRLAMEASAFMGEVNRQIAILNADGTLSGLSEARLNGRDLSLFPGNPPGGQLDSPLPTASPAAAPTP